MSASSRVLGPLGAVALSIIAWPRTVHAQEPVDRPPAQASEDAFARAVERLQARDPAARAEAADEMGRRGHRMRKEIGLLLRPVLTADPVPAVRAAAGRALGRLGARDAVPELVRALRDPSADVRVVAAAALWRLPDPVALPGLVEACADEEPAVREWSALALGVLGNPAAVAPLLTLLADRERAVRLAAVRGLGKVGDPAALGPLLAYLSAGPHDDEEKEEIVRAVSSLRGPDKVSALVKLISGPDRAPADRARLIAALGEVGDELVIPQLRRHTRRGEPAPVRIAAFQAISAVEERAQAKPSAKP